MELSPAEFKRYSRHLKLPEIGLAGQLKLKSAKVLVIGAGGLGCPALQYLAAAGVGTLGIADGDRIDLSNLQRQILYRVDQIGQFKAQAAADHLRAINPEIKINSYCDYLRLDNIESIVREYDIIIDGSDNFSTRYLVNDACVLWDKPLVYGAIFKFSGQLSVFNWQNGPSYRCLYPDIPGADALPACGEIGVLGVLPGIIGAMQANETIKMILNLPGIATGVLLLWDSLSLEMRRIKFLKDPDHFQKFPLKIEIVNCSRPQSDVQILTINELEDWIERGVEFQLLDVRQDWEQAICQLPNSINYSVNNPLQALRNDIPVVVYCHKGSRSLKAAQTLILQDIISVYSLQGGIDAWAQIIDQNMNRY